MLRALLLQIFYWIRSEWLLMEQLYYSLLFRWFVVMNLDERVCDATAFTKNRDRPLNQETARSFFQQVVERARGYMSDEHFTVDGTVIEAGASQKSFQLKQGGGPQRDGGNFHGQQRRNERHASKSAGDARLYGSLAAARWAGVSGNVLMENRHGGRRHGAGRR